MTKSRQVADFGAGGVTAGKNAVINGGMDIWQRGTSTSLAAGVAAYTADRWYVGSGGNATTISRQVTGDTTNLPNIQYAMRYQRNSGQTSTTTLQLSNSFETINSIPYAGKTVTVSFYARAGANFSAASSSLLAYLNTGTGTDQNRGPSTYTGESAAINTGVTLTTTWQRFSFTGTVGATVTEMATLFTYTPSGTAGAADYFEITGVQVEVGSVATPFSRAAGNIQSELAACQRYYWRRTGTQYLGTGSANSATQADFIIQFPVEMRTAPTMATNSGTAYFKAFMGNADTTASTIGNFFTAGTLTVNGRITGSGLTTGYATVGFINNASAYLEASSEL